MSQVLRAIPVVSTPNMMATAAEIAQLEADLLAVIVGYEERTGRRITSLEVVTEGSFRTTAVDATWMTVKPRMM